MEAYLSNYKGRPVREEVVYLICKNPTPSMTRVSEEIQRRYLNIYWSRWKWT